MSNKKITYAEERRAALLAKPDCKSYSSATPCRQCGTTERGICNTACLYCKTRTGMKEKKSGVIKTGIKGAIPEISTKLMDEVCRLYHERKMNIGLISIQTGLSYGFIRGMLAKDTQVNYWKTNLKYANHPYPRGGNSWAKDKESILLHKEKAQLLALNLMDKIRTTHDSIKK